MKCLVYKSFGFLPFSLAILILAVPLLSQPMEITVCSVSHKDKDAGQRLELLKQMGVTSIQTYIYWNKVENERGILDWSEYDADVALFKQHGFKWVPFIIAGPWYVTPEFVRRDPAIVMLRCLEHGRDSAIPSIWCPRIRDYVQEYLRKFAEHYLPQGVLESINLGITGDYGEAIYSVIGNWPGEYHSHGGFWCGDTLAVADFQRAMEDLYGGNIEELNKAWKSRYGSFAEAKPFLPADALSPRARLELIRWYRNSMTEYADFWLATARRYFPETEIYLCTGGDMSPEHGSDFSAQAKVAANHGGGIRITNEASSFPHNVALTRLIDSACRFYGAYFGHEPASAVTPVGMLGRMFNALTAGARQLFLYSTPELIAERDGKPVVGDGGRFHVQYREFQKITVPVVDVAILYPTSSSTHALKNYGRFGDLAAEVRRLLDFDFLDERLVQEEALKAKSILIMAGAEVLEGQTIEKIRAWVEEGGVLFVLDSRPTNWDGEKAVFDGLAGFTPSSDEILGISEMTVEAPQRLPSFASLPPVFVSRSFTNLSAEAQTLLGMKYTPKGNFAWRRGLGKGRVYAYYGPMDVKQREDSWMVAHQLPFRFLKDGIQDALGDKILKKAPLSLNLGVKEAYLVEIEDGLMALNMGNATIRVDYPAGSFEIPGQSLVKIKKR